MIERVWGWISLAWVGVGAWWIFHLWEHGHPILALFCWLMLIPAMLLSFLFISEGS